MVSIVDQTFRSIFMKREAPKARRVAEKLQRNGIKIKGLTAEMTIKDLRHPRDQAVRPDLDGGGLEMSAALLLPFTGYPHFKRASARSGYDEKLISGVSP